jgi:hypothetical protein
MTGYSWTIMVTERSLAYQMHQQVHVIPGNTCNSYTLTVRVTDSGSCTSTCNQIINVTDNTTPTITATGTATNLGCNPSASNITAALGSATASDACGAPTLTISNSAVSSTGCSRSQTRTWTAIDGCGNSATTSRIVNWVVDLTPPTFTGSYTSVTLACNPTASNITAALGTATATDACGSPTISFTDGSVQIHSCYFIADKNIYSPGWLVVILQQHRELLPGPQILCLQHSPVRILT